MKHWLCVAGVGMALSGCIGPIDYISTVAFKARRAVAEADAADAEKLSPYEYWSAHEYLYMAREMASSADYRIANKYGKKAVQMGELAKKNAIQREAAGPSRARTGPPAVDHEPVPNHRPRGEKP